MPVKLYTDPYYVHWDSPTLPQSTYLNSPVLQPAFCPSLTTIFYSPTFYTSDKRPNLYFQGLEAGNGLGRAWVRTGTESALNMVPFPAEKNLSSYNSIALERFSKAGLIKANENFICR